MTQIQKTLKWIWLNKERMVLVVMVAFLCYRVYMVLYPLEPPEEKILRSPRNNPNRIPEEVLPPKPKPRPPIDMPGSYASLHKANPFHAGASKGNTGADRDGGHGLELLRIQDFGDRTRAQIHNTSTNTKKWYDQDEKAEGFEVTEIDAEAEEVKVYVEEFRRTYTLSLD